eukprot:14195830-Ditylum_brightwellii.AAC.1
MADCHRTDRNKQNEHLVYNDDDVDDDVDDGDDNSVHDGVNDDVNDGADGADKHLVHLSQVADCCRTERSKRNKHLVCDEDNDVDDGDDDSDDGADKHLIHLTQ